MHQFGGEGFDLKQSTNLTLDQHSSENSESFGPCFHITHASCPFFHTAWGFNQPTHYVNTALCKRRDGFTQDLTQLNQYKTLQNAAAKTCFLNDWNPWGTEWRCEITRKLQDNEAYTYTADTSDTCWYLWKSLFCNPVKYWGHSLRWCCTGSHHHEILLVFGQNKRNIAI